ncbi:MAG: TonB-dependent receptor domain-containing protein, partial [Bryobacteraceae bacterium]
ASTGQFEDDRNLFLLPGFAVWLATARQRIGAGLELHGAVENAANRRVIAGFSPVPLTGSPRLWRLRLRWCTH